MVEYVPFAFPCLFPSQNFYFRENNPPNEIDSVGSDDSSENESSATNSPILSPDYRDTDDFPPYEDFDMPDYILTPPALSSDAEEPPVPREHTPEDSMVWIRHILN